MRFSSLCIFALSVVHLNAQAVLFEENFNTCALSPGWSVQVSGDTNVLWYVGLAQNPLVQGQSIDNSCFLFIDDSLATPDTPGYVLEFRTPAFDVTPYTAVECTMDVYFRFGETDFLEIIATDGVSESVLARFDNYTTNGATFASGHFSLRHDLALVSQSANTRILLRYTSPSGSTGHYAGIDNIRITGSGAPGAVNLIREAFNGCVKPAGWETEIVNGDEDWHFGRVQLGSSAFYDGNSMDGSCMAYFDDAELGDSVAPSTIRLYTPWFDGDTFFHYTLDADVVFRFSGTEHFAIYLHTGTGDSVELFRRATGQVGGPFFPQYVPLHFDLSAYRAPQMRIAFEYSDGGTWGYWTGIDNVKVTAQGVANERCAQAVPLLAGAPCLTADNSTALFEGPAASCAAGPTVGSLWYRWPADFTGVARLDAAAGFNNVVNLYAGTCADYQPVQCDNRDEHGFTGESTWFAVQAGAEYLIRISGQNGGFGVPVGSVCVGVAAEPAFPAQPANDACANAQPLVAGAPCVPGNNRRGDTTAPLPSLDTLSRADVWYTFTAGPLGPGESYELRSNASFADNITVYQGPCNALQELAGNHHGHRLELPALLAGASYRVQIAGVFATVEDSLCPELVIKQIAVPPNDSCLTAVEVPVGGPCTAGNNTGATFSGYRPSCAVSVDRDIWFKFVAPAFGSVHINTGADFRHTLAIWQGDCNNLTEVFCAINPRRCDGYVTAGNLNAGQTYYLQIATWVGVAGLSAGNVCLKLLDGAMAPDIQAINLNVDQLCVGEDSVTLAISATGGVPPYTYLGTAPGQVLTAGQQYLVVATDAAGCEVSETGVAAGCAPELCALVATITSVHQICSGDTTGALTASLAGGAGPFMYHWSNDVLTANNNNLPPGTYTVTVTDANGCSSTASATLAGLPSPSAAINTAPALCPGDLAVLTASGGGNYAWSSGAATAQVALNTTGIYTVTVTAANGCTNTATATVALPPAFALSTAVSAVACHGGTNGTATLMISGGTAPYTYLWSNGQTAVTAAGLVANTYTVVATDANGCANTLTATVTQPPPLALNVSVTNVACSGGANGTATVAISGGTPPYAYQWNTGQTGAGITGLPANTYTVFISDANACPATASAAVTQPPPLGLNTAIVTNVSCHSGANGVISGLAASGGAAPYTYTWNSGQTTAAIAGLSAGTYTVIATDANGCTKSAAATVTQPPALALNTSVTGPVCSGGTNGTASLAVSGGTAPYTYLWSNGQATAAATGLAATVYTVTATDANGCTNTTAATVPEPLPISVNAAVTNIACYGGTNGAIALSVSGGLAPYTYLWNNGQTVAAISGLNPSVYTVTVRDALACTTMKTVAVTQPAPISVTTTIAHVTCVGGDNGLLALTASGGTAPYHYQWSSGQTTAVIAHLMPGSYTATVTDSAPGGGCSTTASATVATVPVENLVQVSVRVFLQGPYVGNAGLMHDSLRVKGLIPLTEPYSGLPNFSPLGGGEQTTAAVLARSGPDAIVDWVFLELRSAANPAQVLATRSALLQRDGDVVEVDGILPVQVNLPAGLHYFIAVRHRNHLGVQLGGAVFYPHCTVMETDFSTLPPEGYYAFNGLNPAQKLADEVYLLWAGNGSVDYQLKYNGSSNDRTAILAVVGLSTPNAVVPGYKQADFNLDGLVKYNGSANDRNVLLGNVGITTPSAIVHDQVAR